MIRSWLEIPLFRLCNDARAESNSDNFRLFHTPGIFYSYPFKLRSIPSTAKGAHPLSPPGLRYQTIFHPLTLNPTGSPS